MDPAPIRLLEECDTGNESGNTLSSTFRLAVVGNLDTHVDIGITIVTSETPDSGASTSSESGGDVDGGGNVVSSAGTSLRGNPQDAGVTNDVTDSEVVDECISPSHDVQDGGVGGDITQLWGL